MIQRQGKRRQSGVLVIGVLLALIALVAVFAARGRQRSEPAVVSTNEAVNWLIGNTPMPEPLLWWADVCGVAVHFGSLDLGPIRSRSFSKLSLTEPSEPQTDRQVLQQPR